MIESLAAAYQTSQRVPRIIIGAGMKPDTRIQALLNGTIDIAMASHGIDIEQINKLGLKVHRIAKVAVVMGVNHNVNVNNLSHQQLCAIYSGETTNWQSLGGTDLLIRPFIRPFNEVDTEVFQAKVGCFSTINVSQGVKTQKKSGQMARAIATTPGAIGMTTLIRVRQSEGRIKALSLDKIQPDTGHLINGMYPLTRDMFLITHGKPEQKVSSFLTFIHSTNGRQNIISNNAIPVSNQGQ